MGYPLSLHYAPDRPSFSAGRSVKCEHTHSLLLWPIVFVAVVVAVVAWLAGLLAVTVTLTASLWTLLLFSTAVTFATVVVWLGIAIVATVIELLKHLSACMYVHMPYESVKKKEQARILNLLLAQRGDNQCDSTKVISSNRYLSIRKKTRARLSCWQWNYSYC